MSFPSDENAFGQPVPLIRAVNTLDVAVETMGCDPLLADPTITWACKYIEQDEPGKALTVLQNIVDITGAYRLLATLCTGDS